EGFRPEGPDPEGEQGSDSAFLRCGALHCNPVRSDGARHAPRPHRTPQCHDWIAVGPMVAAVLTFCRRTATELRVEKDQRAIEVELLGRVLAGRLHEIEQGPQEVRQI